MNFTSVTFLFLFFPLCVGFYYLSYILERRFQFLLNLRLKDIVLILCSLFFYAWFFFIHIFFFIGYILIIFAFGYWIGKAKTRRKIPLIISLLFSLSILFCYKYVPYLFSLLHGISLAWTPLVPLGLSFIIFSSVSYLVDIYRNDAPCISFLDCALYLLFFPKVVSGQIILWKDFDMQIQNRIITVQHFLHGLNRVMIGFVKKLIIADTLGQMILFMKSNFPAIDLLTAWGCMFLYALEIYIDFSAYSDIAIGLARLFGFSFAENFDFPYRAISIPDFWRKWHVSLGTWFREYVYIPLGGNRKGFRRTLVNVMIVFILTGIWHGAGFAYLAWGLLHAVFSVTNRILSRKKWFQSVPVAIKWFSTMLIVSCGWLCFLFGSFRQVTDYIRIMFGSVLSSFIPYSFRYYFDARIIVIGIIAFVLSTLFSKKLLHRFAPFCFDVDSQNTVCRKQLVYSIAIEIVLILFFVLSIVYMVNSTYSPFIYFQY